jgi:hypothetical protein
MSESDFEVLPAGEMRAKYGLTAKNRPSINLDVAKVPAALRHLLPLVERFGVSDDLLAKTTTDDLEAMREAVRPHEDAFDAWLAGPAAYGPGFSDEYMAFPCLRMAADGV